MQAQNFLPTFVKETDKILNDPELKRQAQMNMDIKQIIPGMALDEEELTEQKIQMEIGVGIYDVLDPEAGEIINKKVDNMLPESTEQIIKVNGVKSESESSSDEDDDDLYLNFGSSDDEAQIMSKIKKIEKKAKQDSCDQKSDTTKSTAKKVLIQDITNM